MATQPPNPGERWERMTWARQRRYAKAVEAATALQIDPNTYRTYERPTENAGRWPKPAMLARIAGHFGVSWAWLETGDGDPLAPEQMTEELQTLNDVVVQLPRHKKEDALRAARSVLESYLPNKRGV